MAKKPYVPPTYEMNVKFIDALSGGIIELRRVMRRILREEAFVSVKLKDIEIHRIKG